MIITQITSKIYGILFCILMLASFPAEKVIADEGNDSVPDIQLSWKPNLQEGCINLELTNKSKIPIALSPELRTLIRLPGREDPAALLYDNDSKTITAAAFITGPVPDSVHLVPIIHEGPPPKSIEIGAGETKTIKLFADPNLITIAKGSTTCGLYLFQNRKVISLTPMTITNGVWKQN